MGSAFHDEPYEALDSAIFISLNRSIWGVAMAAIIMICEYGTVREYFFLTSRWNLGTTRNKTSRAH